MLTGGEIREKYLNFFEGKSHTIIPSAPIVPIGDPTTLFTGSGMQPLIPYLLGQPHPAGKRLANSQKSFRAEDIEEVGDNRHTTFFEMLGNWSLGDYFKEAQLSWFFQFLIEEIKLDPSKLYVSVFIGDPDNKIPADEESVAIWESLFKEKGVQAKSVRLGSVEKASELGPQGGRIFYYDVRKNWWARNGAIPSTMPVGEPGGPDSEVFYDFGTPHDPKYGKECHPNCDCGRFLEIGNSVFMQYQKQTDGSLKELPKKNVDFGGGLERIAAAANNDPDIFNIDIFKQARELLEESILASSEDVSKSVRIILDHLRASIFLLDGGVEPSNKAQGYVLRKLLRRMMLHAKILNIDLSMGLLTLLIGKLTEPYFQSYPTIKSNKQQIQELIEQERNKFDKALEKGIKEIGKTSDFDLYQTYGFPPELIKEAKIQQGLDFDEDEFESELHKHQELSRKASAGMFRGGLADQSETVVKYHTTTHLLQQALRDVLGNHVHQAGSNITGERLRFDFTHSKPLSPDEIKKVEEIINQKVEEDLTVTSKVMPYEEAIKSGALAFFKEKYPEKITVYQIGDYSKELCGGPHVTHTGEIGNIKVIKQESLGSSLRRIYLKLASQEK